MTDLATYAAPCTRVCVMRSGLLSRDEWRTLFAAESTEAALSWLDRRGIFGEAVPDILSAERAAHISVIRDTNALLRFVRGDQRPLLRFFVYYYDLLNVESTIHQIFSFSEGAHSGAFLYDTGRLGLLRNKDLTSLTNYAALSKALKHTMLSSRFDAALLRFSENEDATRLVEAVDIGFLTAWVAAAERCGFRVRGGGDGWERP